MWSCDQILVTLTLDQKNQFLGMALQFYTSVTKVLKLKVRKFQRLTPTFVEPTVENLVGSLNARVKVTKCAC